MGMIEVGSIYYKQGGDFLLTAGNFKIEQGEKVAVLGENGSGKKSTLMHLMTGVIGNADIRYMGQPLKKMSYIDRARMLSFLPQMPEVSFPFTVFFEVVKFGQYNASNEDIEEATNTSLRMADIYHLKERVFSELSGGEKRRVMLARVINQGSPVQILDEPVSMLDIRHELEILDLLVNSDKTVVASIHDVNLAVEYFDRFIFLKKMVSWLLIYAKVS